MNAWPTRLGRGLVLEVYSESMLAELAVLFVAQVSQPQLDFRMGNEQAAQAPERRNPGLRIDALERRKVGRARASAASAAAAAAAAAARATRRPVLRHRLHVPKATRDKCGLSRLRPKTRGAVPSFSQLVCTSERRAIQYDAAWMIHNTNETWKLERMNFARLSWRPQLVEAVNLFTDGLGLVRRSNLSSYLPTPFCIEKAGNVGAAIAHISLWQRLLAENLCGALVFEDNVIFRDDSMARVNATLWGVPMADFVNFAVLRPRGSLHSATNGVHRYVVAKLHEPMPNVWLSSYFVSRRGAERLLVHFAQNRLNFNNLEIDREVSRFLSSNASNQAFFTEPAVFGHEETSHDMRRSMNGRSVNRAHFIIK